MNSILRMMLAFGFGFCISRPLFSGDHRLLPLAVIFLGCYLIAFVWSLKFE